VGGRVKKGLRLLDLIATSRRQWSGRRHMVVAWLGRESRGNWAGRRWWVKKQKTKCKGTYLTLGRRGEWRDLGASQI